jgi:hypothetical protein
MIADFHVHSKYSYDSILSPRSILKVAKRHGLNCIAVTDHNTIKGGIVTQKLNIDKDFLVIVGIEVQTEIGDIIGLNLTEEIKSKNSIDAIEEIRSQGGYVILPHPSRGHKLNEYVITNSDAIEVFNGRSTVNQNNEALDLAKKYNKPFAAGSDAHFASEIGIGRFNINFRYNRQGILFPSNEKSILGEHSPWYLINLSQIIKSVKTKNFTVIPKQIFDTLYQTL